MDTERTNRRFWDADADEYQDRHGEQLRQAARAWGVWRVPEDELHVLGAVNGLDVLELGCGAAQWSVALAAAGARAFSVDQSRVQLAHARRAIAAAGVDVSLLLASATSVPVADRSFDVVFCDHGAMSFCDPAESVPEVARILRPGGLLAFCTTTALVYLTYNARRDRQTRRLQHRAFGRRRWTFDEGTTDFCVPTGEWLRHFHAHGLVPEDLVELRAPRGATTTYADYVPYRWARRWPAEQIWKVRKA